MSDIFLKVVNMSITAGWLVLAVILLRLLLKKAPRWMVGILWGLVGFRLILPFSLESQLSLIPSSETLPPDMLTADTPAIQSGIPFFNSSVNPILGDSLAPQVGDSVNPMQVIVFIAAIVWLAGMLGMTIYALVSYLRLRHRVAESVPLRDTVYLCDRIATPFILGVIKPRIYLPSTIGEEKMGYVIAHEQAHLRRHDHWWKPLGFLLLTVHWFNPLLWAGYILLCRDIELATDEKVMKELGEEIKQPYAEALLSCSLPRKSIAACPLAFGEVGVKQRIKGVLQYKKSAFWVIVVAIVATVVAAVCFLTDPPSGENVSSDSDQSTVGGVDGPQVTVIMEERYRYQSERDICQLELSTDDKQFSLSLSIYSSYWPHGRYEETDTALFLYTDDGQNHYTFRKVDDTLVFDAAASSAVPRYTYKKGEDSQTCLPNGTVLSRQDISVTEAPIDIAAAVENGEVVCYLFPNEEAEKAWRDGQ